MSRIGVVLPAGGLGRRLGADRPKQLLELAGQPVFRYALNTFLTHPKIAQVVLVVPGDWFDWFEKELADVPVDLAVGGKERWNSVLNGINVLDSSIAQVLVHDIARPLISHDLISNVIDQLQRGPVIVAKPVSDTVKRVVDGLIVETLDRNSLWLAQTPQAAQVDLLKKCFENIPEDYTPTDEASLLEFFNYSVSVVEGNALNDKITRQEDLDRFQIILQGKVNE